MTNPTETPIYNTASIVTSGVFERHPDLSNQLSRLENGPPVGCPIQIRISGPEFDGLYALANKVTDQLSNY